MTDLERIRRDRGSIVITVRQSEFYLQAAVSGVSVMLLDDGVSPGKLVTGTDFREDLPREIEQAEQQAQEERYVDALKRSYVWFDEQGERREE